MHTVQEIKIENTSKVSNLVYSISMVRHREMQRAFFLHVILVKSFPLLAGIGRSTIGPHWIGCHFHRSDGYRRNGFLSLLGVILF